MAKLHELLAVEADLQKAAQQMAADAVNTFSKKPDHFRGQVRTVSFFDDARQGENLSEEKAMVTTVDDKLEYALKFVGKYFDAILKKETANQGAKADLIVDGQTIAKDVPATFLLGMESRFKEIREMVLAIPTLEPAIKWELDPAKGDGVYSAPPTASMKTEKVISAIVLYEATKEHPAQVKETSKDVAVARIETHVTSGMWSPARKAVVIERIDAILRGIKKARQRANTVDVTEVYIAKSLFSYMLFE